MSPDLSLCNNVNEILCLFLFSDVLKSAVPYSLPLPRNLNVKWLFRWGVIFWLFTYKSLRHGHITKGIERCVSLFISAYFCTRSWEAALDSIFTKRTRFINSWVLQVDTSNCVNEFVSRTVDRTMHCCWRVCERMLVSTLVRCVLLTSTGHNEAW